MGDNAALKRSNDYQTPSGRRFSLVKRTEIARHNISRAGGVPTIEHPTEYLVDACLLVAIAVLFYFDFVFIIKTAFLFGAAGIWCFAHFDRIVFYCYKVGKFVHHKSKLQRMPRRIFLIRHGQSEGNVDHNIYAKKPDNKIELTTKGVSQAKNAGKVLREMIGDETVRFFVSPYRRAQQTYHNIAESFDDNQCTYREEPRLREQDWGNFQDPDQVLKCREERRKFGSFYYRLPNGESGSDVYDRVTSFWSTIIREFKYKNCLENFVMVSHGITLRLFLMRYFKWTVDEMQATWNLENCQILVMRLQDGKYVLETPLKRDPVHKNL